MSKPPESPVARRLPQVNAISLTISDIDIIRTPDAWLNSDCIDTLGAWIQILLAKSSPTTQHCAIFSTLVFPKATGGRNLRQTSRQRGSLIEDSRDIWIIPIHYPNEHHWVLAVAIRSQMKLYLYDSFAGDLASWSADISLSAEASETLPSPSDTCRISRAGAALSINSLVSEPQYCMPFPGVRGRK
ncbi:hypothetical protein C8J56DRAFT_1054211 [Mycena floridula]|nr:hypothetical protein C8J56DRAFT_1054211 [Mycena floridula]